MNFAREFGLSNFNKFAGAEYRSKYPRPFRGPGLLRRYAPRNDGSVYSATFSSPHQSAMNSAIAVVMRFTEARLTRSSEP